MQKKIQNIQSMWSIIWSKIDRAENTALQVSGNTRLLSCNMQKILLMEKESVIIWKTNVSLFADSSLNNYSVRVCVFLYLYLLLGFKIGARIGFGLGLAR